MIPTMFFGIGASKLFHRLVLALISIGWLLPPGAVARQADEETMDRSIAAYRDRMLTQAKTNQPPTGKNSLLARRFQNIEPSIRPTANQAATQPERQSLMTQPAAATQPALQDVLFQIPDPEDAPRVFEERLARLRNEKGREQRIVKGYERVSQNAMELLDLLNRNRSQKVNLGLAECIQRALENNYSIRIEAYNPAISQTQVVEAEAAFDTTFFLDVSSAQTDDPVANPATTPGQGTLRSYGGGFRQLLPTGMQVEVGLQQQRRTVDFQDETINIFDRYATNFNATFRQPLLRGFGLDFNRAQINIRKADQRIAQYQFQQQVRDTLLNVETAYWRLSQARRTVAILAETVAQNYITYEDIKKRMDLDATPVELNNSLSQYKSRYVQYIESIKTVRDAEDVLKNLLNDPNLRLSEDLELIPTETPFVTPFALDQFAEVRTALDYRTEIDQAKLTIDKARIGTMVAKNQTLPQLDVSFQYEVKGLGSNADSSFNQMTDNDYRSYAVTANFSYPIGNRGPEAGLKRARMQEQQAVVALNQVTDRIVQEVNDAVRTLVVRYVQVPPSLDAVIAGEQNLRALQARTQKIDPSYLQTELNAVDQVANTRRTLLQVVIDYNVGVVELEKSKGTLLQYNNIVITDAPPRK